MRPFVFVKISSVREGVYSTTDRLYILLFLILLLNIRRIYNNRRVLFVENSCFHLRGNCLWKNRVKMWKNRGRRIVENFLVSSSGSHEWSNEVI